MLSHFALMPVPANPGVGTCKGFACRVEMHQPATLAQHEAVVSTSDRVGVLHPTIPPPLGIPSTNRLDSHAPRLRFRQRIRELSRQQWCDCSRHPYVGALGAPRSAQRCLLLLGGGGNETGCSGALEARGSEEQSSTDLAAACALAAARVIRGMGVSTRHDTTSNARAPAKKTSSSSTPVTGTAATPSCLGPMLSSLNKITQARHRSLIPSRHSARRDSLNPPL